MDKSAQKISIFSGKANYARSLIIEEISLQNLNFISNKTVQGLD